MPETKGEEVGLDQLIQLRHQLHAKPCLSGEEGATARLIEEFLNGSKPSRVEKNLGGNGLAFIYDSGRPGPSIGFRCELDALPIHEKTGPEYASAVEGVSHKCGHDGHMAILAGIGHWLKVNPPEKGSILLLFQPAEETGEGAAAVVQDSRWKDIKPEMLFGLHNIPGKPAGEILWKEGHFCAASKGLFIQLTGYTSHAAEPENGRNPARAMSKILLELQAQPEKHHDWKGLVLVTPVFAHLGEKAFGISAGAAELGFTLRTFHEEDIDRLSNRAEEVIKNYCHEEGIGYSLKYVEEFPATTNHTEPLAYVRKAIEAEEMQHRQLEEPFRFSEDFGHYGRSCPTAFVGLGAGEEQPALHHPDYDFPDHLISPGLQLFTGIIREIQAAHK